MTRLSAFEEFFVLVFNIFVSVLLPFGRKLKKKETNTIKEDGSV